MIFILFVQVVLPSCTMIPVRELTSSEAAAVRLNAKSIVLFRISGTDDGKPIMAWETGWDRTFIRLIPVRITTLPPKFIPVVKNNAPSEEAQKAGWRYLLLEPGSYRILIDTPYGTEGTWRDSDGSNRRPSYWINVPPEKPIIYAGSIHISCTTRHADIQYKACSSEVLLNDETEAATDIAIQNFPEFGRLEKILVSRYGSSLSKYELSLLQSVRIVTGNGKNLDYPDWKAKAHERYFGGGDSRYGGNCYGPGCGGLILLAFAYWPFAAALETSEVAAAEQAWGPCIEQLVNELHSIDVPNLLGRRVAERAREAGNTLAVELSNHASDEEYSLQDGALELILQRIQFRQCNQEGGYCFELAVRARVKGTFREPTLYDAFLTYTNSNAWHSKEEIGIEWLQQIVQPESACSDLGRFCGSGGADRFRIELIKAVDVIAKALIN
ncbi:MAG: hypothetical protein WBQ78_04795 [Gammaproteobacteria bacterium]